MSLQELEQAVTSLPEADLEAFASWFEQYLSDAWDRQIEADAKSGQLEAVTRRIRKDFEAGNCTPL
jgi:hypothetical protein